MATALQSGYGVQYWGADYTATTLAQAPHGLLILESAKLGATDTPDRSEQVFTPSETAMMQGTGRPVLYYLNLTEIEPWRDYRDAKGMTPDIRGPQLGPDETLARWWSQDWQETLMRRVDRLMASGADGLFLDDALHYYTTGALTDPPKDAPATIPEAATKLMALVIAVTERMRAGNCDALAVVNNAVFAGRDAGPDHAALFHSYRQSIDGILVESALGAADHPDLHLALREDYLSQGLPVLTLDFATADNAAQALSDRAFALGYAPYVASDASFSSLDVTRLPR